VSRDESGKGNVTSLKVVMGGRNREPQLSDAELIAIRAMLADFEKIARGCPTARYLLDRG
jgi:hypothetical protein